MRARAIMVCVGDIVILWWSQPWTTYSYEAWLSIHNHVCRRRRPRDML